MGLSLWSSVRETVPVVFLLQLLDLALKQQQLLPCDGGGRVLGFTATQSLLQRLELGLQRGLLLHHHRQLEQTHRQCVKQQVQKLSNSVSDFLLSHGL